MTSTPSSSAMSPISDVGSDDGKSKQNSYYAQIVGTYSREPIKSTFQEGNNTEHLFHYKTKKMQEREIDLIVLDHSYSKPWSAHPDASHARPAKTLFVTKHPKNLDDSIIDVDSYTIRNVIAYDEVKARSVMDECERHVRCLRMDEGNPDWEENLANIRNSWSVAQNRLFNKVVKIFHSDRLARLACVNHPNEPVLRRVSADRTAKRLRQAFASVHWDMKLCQWLHSTLVEHLYHPYLAAYMEALQTLKAKIPVLVDKMVAMSISASRVGAKTAEAVSLVLKRPWDPVAPQFVPHKTKKLPGSPLLLFVPSGPAHPTAGNSRRTRFWNTQLAAMGKVIPVTMHSVNAGSSLTVNQCLEHLISAIRTKVTELQTHFPNRSIVLIGWNVGALAACHVALVESVSAIVCLGFPFTGITGKRGDVDDPLLESKTPILFIIGQCSSLCRQDDLEEMRDRMRAETSLVLVGGADNHLRLSHAKKKAEGVTTSMVDRCLLDEISEFLGSVLTRHPVHNLDTSYTSTGSTNSSDSSSVKDGRKRKKKVLPSISQETRGYSFGPAVRRKPGMSIASGQGSHANVNSKVVMHSAALNNTTGKRQMTFTAKRRRNQASPLMTPSPNKRRLMWSSATADSLSSDSSNQSQPSVSTPVGLDTNQNESNFNDYVNFSFAKDSPDRANRGISFNIGSLSSLSRNNFSKSSTTLTVPESETNSYPQVVYKRMSNPMSAAEIGGTSYGDLIAKGRGSRLRIGRGGNISSSNSAFFTIPKSTTPSGGGMSSLLTSSGVRPPNYLFATLPNKGSLLSAQLMEPDQNQVQAIQKLQFHDFPLTTASLTKTNASGNPVITQAKILSNFNKMQGLVTTSTATTAIRQSIIPGIVTSTTTTQSLLTSASSAFVRSTPVHKAYLASPSSLVGSKHNLATSLLLGSKVARVVESSGKTSLCEILPSMSLQLPSKLSTSSGGKAEEVAVLMLSDNVDKIDEDLPSAELDINKALGGVDLTGSDDNLLDIIGDINQAIESALADNPLPLDVPSFNCPSDSDTLLSGPIPNDQEVYDVLNLPPDQLRDVLDGPVQEGLKTDDPSRESLLASSDPVDTNENNFPEMVDPQMLNEPESNSNPTTPHTPGGRTHRPIFPTIASTRTRRIRTPKYYDI